MLEKEEMLVTSIFSFSHNVFDQSSNEFVLSYICSVHRNLTFYNKNKWWNMKNKVSPI